MYEYTNGNFSVISLNSRHRLIYKKNSSILLFSTANDNVCEDKKGDEGAKEVKYKKLP